MLQVFNNSFLNVIISLKRELLSTHSTLPKFAPANSIYIIDQLHKIHSVTWMFVFS